MALSAWPGATTRPVAAKAGLAAAGAGAGSGTGVSLEATCPARRRERFEGIGDGDADAVELGRLRRGISEFETADRRRVGRAGRHLGGALIEFAAALLARDNEILRAGKLQRDLASRRIRGQRGEHRAELGLGPRRAHELERDGAIRLHELDAAAIARGPFLEDFQRRADLDPRLVVGEDLELDGGARLLRRGRHRRSLRSVDHSVRLRLDACLIGDDRVARPLAENAVDDAVIMAAPDQRVLDRLPVRFGQRVERRLLGIIDRVSALRRRRGAIGPQCGGSGQSQRQAA